MAQAFQPVRPASHRLESLCHVPAASHAIRAHRTNPTHPSRHEAAPLGCHQSLYRNPVHLRRPESLLGDPSYYLEPGDPGFVPYPPLAGTLPSQPKKRNKHPMPKSDYISQNDDQFAAQLDAFKTGISPYATQVGVSPAQITSQAADAAYLGYVVACQGMMQGASQQWTAWKNLVRGGGTPPATGAPMAPMFPAAVPAVALGIEVRFRALVKQIKAHANYNPAIGEALGIEGAVHGAPALTTLQAVLTALLTGNAVLIGWGWQGFGAFLDMLEIQVDRGDGKGWVMLAFDTTPDYTDTHPLPATPAKWKYRGIYRVADAQVGIWSNTVEITVGG